MVASHVCFIFGSESTNNEWKVITWCRVFFWVVSMNNYSLLLRNQMVIHQYHKSLAPYSKPVQSTFPQPTLLTPISIFPYSHFNLHFQEGFQYCMYFSVPINTIYLSVQFNHLKMRINYYSLYYIIFSTSCYILSIYILPSELKDKFHTHTEWAELSLIQQNNFC